MTVKVFSTPTCPWCKKTKEFLKKKNIDFVDVDVSKDKDGQQEMMDKSGQMGVPVIDVNGKIIVGFDVEAINKALG